MHGSTQWWVYSTPDLNHRHQYWQRDEHTSKKSWHYDSALGNPQKWRDKEISLWKKGHIIEIFFSTRHTIKCQEALLRLKLSAPISPWALVLNSSEREAGTSSKGPYPTEQTHPQGLGASALAVSPTQLTTHISLSNHHRRRHQTFAWATELFCPLWQVPTPSDTQAWLWGTQWGGVRREKHRWIIIKTTGSSLSTSCLSGHLQMLGFVFFSPRPMNA